jgi:hypothetical protein
MKLTSSRTGRSPTRTTTTGTSGGGPNWPGAGAAATSTARSAALPVTRIILRSRTEAGRGGEELLVG